MSDDIGGEEELSGGNAAGRVVRVGATVRKPWLPTSERTIGYMLALADRGVDLPTPHGADDQGRLTLEFVPGELAISSAPLDLATLHRVGALVRSIHDASEGLPLGQPWEVLIPVERPDLLCHNDLATWNLVIDGDRLVFIDWDGAGPSTRLWDLAYAAIAFGHLFPGTDVDTAASRLKAFVDGYGADAAMRRALPATMARRAEAMHELLRASHGSGREPWATMYVEGHGEHWARTSRLIARHMTAWALALMPA